MTPTPKRRWFRFSLRTLFVVVTVLGCWWGWNLKWVNDRQRALVRVEKTGGTYDECNHPYLGQNGIAIPAVCRLLGARPMACVWFKRGSMPVEECKAIAALFGEANVGYMTGSPSLSEPLD